MIVPSALLGLIESTLNQHIAHSRDAQNILQKISGEHIAIHITGINIQLHLFTHNTNLRLHNAPDTTPSASLSGSPVDLIASLKTRGFADGLTLTGNTHAIHGLQKMLMACELDIEALISECIGEMPAHFLGQRTAQIGRWIGRYKTTVDMAVRDYLQEEVQHTPTRIEVDNFMNDIDDARMHADRLEARLNALTSKKTNTKAQA